MLFLLLTIVFLFVYLFVTKEPGLLNRVKIRRCSVDNDCDLGRRCGYYCFNKEHEDIYKRTRICPWQPGRVPACECKLGFCFISF